MTTKMAARQQLVTIEGIPGRWASKSGGNRTADTSPVWDGGESEPDILAGPASNENVTVSRPKDEVRDLPEIKRLRRGVGRFTGTITVQDTDADLFPIGEPTVYPDALLIGFNETDYDAGSSDPQVVELVFATPRVA